MNAKLQRSTAVAVLGLLFLAACGGGNDGASPPQPAAPVPTPAPTPAPAPATYTVGGTVTGLRGATALVLDEAGELLTVAVDGSFTFATPRTAGAGYDVKAATQPTDPWQTCVVANGNGVVAAANVTDVQVTCTTNRYPVGGTVIGLAGATGLVLQNNGGDDLPIAAEGGFAFAAPVESGASYQVVVARQPVGATCAANRASGTITDAAVSTVLIQCSALTYTIGGSVTGLSPQAPASAGLVLVNNGGDRLPIFDSGRFTFPTPVPHGAAFTVALAIQPTSPPQTCVVDPATAHAQSVTADVTTVEVRCLTLNTAGSLDTAFGTNGVVVIDFEAARGADTTPSALLQPADGALLIAGTTDSAASKDFALLRVGADGKRDATFNRGANDGFVRTNIASGTNSIDYARAIGRQSDGRLIVAGYTSTWDFALARYSADGALDTSFGDGGRTVTHVGVIDYGFALAIDAADRIIVAGTTSGNGSSGEDFLLVRFAADGRPDTGFNGGDPANTTGAVRTHFSRDDRAQAVAVQPDGRIVAAGYANGAGSDFALARYLDDGRLDTGFGAAGTGRATAHLGSVDRATAMLIQPGGEIVVGGYTGVASGINFALVRLTASGVLDTTFDADGIVLTDIGGDDDRINALALDSSGRIVAAGYSRNGLNTDIALARYAQDGKLDPTFGVGGVVVTAVGGGNDLATSVVIQPDGRIVAVGQSDNGTNGNNVNVDYVLVRFLP
jgi:uncharacterized delta-60 repeat protein